MPRKHSLIFCLIWTTFCLPVRSDGQGLAEDLRDILVLTDSLPQYPTREARIRAVDRLLGLLRHYTEAAPHAERPERTRRQELQALSDNPYLVRLAEELNWDTLLGPTALDQSPAVSGPSGPFAPSTADSGSETPAEYLSAARLLPKYQTPARPAGQYLRQTAAAYPSAREGVPVTQAVILKATADFILKRAREEVAITFLDQLANEDVRKLPCWFPTVARSLHRTDQLLSQAFLAQLQQAFLEDLQSLPFRLPSVLLSDTCGLKRPLDAQAYQLLTVYALVGHLLAGEGATEATGGAHRQLYRMYAEQTKESNLLLASRLENDRPALAGLVALADSLEDQLVDTYRELVQLEDRLSERILTGLSSMPGGETRPVPPSPQDYLDNRRYRLDAALGAQAAGFDLLFLSQLLEGAFDPTEVLDQNTLAGYDRFFGKDWTPLTMRAVGLELLQNVGGTAPGRPSMDLLFEEWLGDLSRYHRAVAEWTAQVERRPPTLQDQVLATRNQVEGTMNHWAAVPGGLAPHDELRFTALLNLTGRETLSDLRNAYAILSESDPDVRNRRMTETLETHLSGVLQRLATLEASLRRQYPAFPPYLAAEAAAPDTPTFPETRERIKALAGTLAQTRVQLADLEQAYAPMLSERRRFAAPLLQVTRLSSDLLFFLLGDTDQPSDPGAFQGLMQDPVHRDLLVGLLLQRWRNGRDPAHLSPAGLEDILLATAQALPLLSEQQLPDSIGQSPYAAAFGKLFFTVHTLRQVLETPLLPTGRPGEYQTVLQAYPGPLVRFTEMSQLLTHFIYYSHTRNHGRAIATLGSLLGLLEDIDRERGGGSNPAVRFLEKYGPFLGGLLEATETAEVEALLEEVADPPGSSRIKRTASLSAGINAYLGANILRETWSGPVLPAKARRTKLVPTVPVGVHFSLTLGPAEKPHSFSAFLSMVDLGAALDFSAEGSGEAETALTFKNVLKPSLQVHYNIRRSPFYVGAGWQGGPQFVDIDGKQATVRSSRFFLGMGVDVPLFTLYRR